MAMTILMAGLLLSALVVGTGPHPGRQRQEREAEAHYLRAVRALDLDDLDHRREGLRQLEEAVRLAPLNPDYRLALARTYFAGGYFRAARKGYEQAAQAESSAAYLGLGLWWRHEWLESGDARALDRAAEALMSAAWLKPQDCDAWLLLVPLYLAQGKREEAASAAFGALVANSRRIEARLAVAATLCHLGAVTLGDSIFRATIPRLPEGLRARYEAEAPLPPGLPSASFAPVRGPPEDGAGSLDALLNRVEAWSRLTERNVLLPGPGARAGEVAADLWARYGSPDASQVGQVGRRLKWGKRGSEADSTSGPVWQYPDLGFRVVIVDRLRALRPDLPDTEGKDTVALPGPALMAMFERVLAALGGGPGSGPESAPVPGILGRD